jgi:hypothetical protein
VKDKILTLVKESKREILTNKILKQDFMLLLSEVTTLNVSKSRLTYRILFRVMGLRFSVGDRTVTFFQNCKINLPIIVLMSVFYVNKC